MSEPLGQGEVVLKGVRVFEGGSDLLEEFSLFSVISLMISTSSLNPVGGRDSFS